MTNADLDAIEREFVGSEYYYTAHALIQRLREAEYALRRIADFQSKSNLRDDLLDARDDVVAIATAALAGEIK